MADFEEALRKYRSEKKNSSLSVQQGNSKQAKPRAESYTGASAFEEALSRYRAENGIKAYKPIQFHDKSYYQTYTTPEVRDPYLDYDLPGAYSRREELEDEASRIRSSINRERNLSGRSRTGHSAATSSNPRSSNYKPREADPRAIALAKLTSENAGMQQDIWKAERAQTLDKYQSYAKAADFKEYVAKGAAIDVPDYKSVDAGPNIFGWQPFAKNVGNKVKYGRENFTEVLLTAGENTRKKDKYAIYHYMTDDEVAAYNYTLAKHGEAEADKYLDALEFKLTARRSEEEAQKLAKATEDDPVGNNVMSLFLAPTRGQGGMYALAANAVGKEVDPNNSAFGATRAVRNIRGTTSKMISESSDGWFTKEALPFVYQTGMSVLDNAFLIATGMPQAAVLVAMGTGAASDTMIEAFDRGATQSQAVGLGVAAGIAEVLFEKISLDSVIKMSQSRTAASLLKNLLKQSGIEASEEVCTEIANIVSDIAIMSEKSSYNVAVQHYMTEGLVTQDQAEKKAFLDLLGQVGLAGLGGMLSGGMMGTGATAIANYNMGQDLKRSGAGQGLVDAALTTDQDSKAYKMALEMSAKQQDGTYKAKDNLSGGKLRRLSAANTTAINAQTMAEVNATVDGSKNAAAISKVFNKIINGNGVSAYDAALIRGDQQASELFSRMFDVKTENLTDSDMITIAENRGYGAQLTPSVTTPTAGEKTALWGVSAGESGNAGVSGSAAYTVPSENAAREGYTFFTVGEDTSIKTPDGTAVPVANVQFSSPAVEHIYQSAARLDNPAAANAMVGSYEGGDAVAYAKAFSAMYRSAKVGLSYQQAVGASLYAQEYLSESQRAAAYEAGSSTRIADEVRTRQVNAENRARSIQAAHKQGKSNMRQEARGEYKPGVNREYSDQKLTPERRKHLRVIDEIFKAAGKKIIIHDKIGKQDGQIVYNRSGGNAYYDPITDTYHLSLDAIGQAYAFVTVHESIHEMRAKNPDGYDLLRDIVSASLEGNLMNRGMTAEEARAEIDRMVKHQADLNGFYTEKGGQRAYSEDNLDDAMEEVIANTVPVILTDETQARRFADKVKRAGNDIRAWFEQLLKDLVDILDKAYSALSKEQSWEQMELIRKDKNAIQMIADAYFEGMEGSFAPEEMSEAGIKLSIREEAPPKKTIKAYKFFGVRESDPGVLFAAYVDTGDRYVPGVWYNGDAGKTVTVDGKQKAVSKGSIGQLNPLAFRPGIHAGEMPSSPQNRTGSGTGNKIYENDMQVWAEIEMSADIDYAADAQSDKAAGIADGLGRVPVDGYYKWNTSSFTKGQWYIAGAMKINRVLKDSEVRDILYGMGYKDGDRFPLSVDIKAGRTDASPENHGQYVIPMKHGGDINLEKFGFGILSAPSLMGDLLKKNTYDYNNLVKQQPMKVLAVPELDEIIKDNGIDKKEVVDKGRANARNIAAGITDDNSVYVLNTYTGRNITVSGASIKHGLDGKFPRLSVNSKLGVIAGELSQNALPVNELVKSNNNADYTYAMVGYAVSKGREYIGILHVDHLTNSVKEIEIIDDLHSINGRSKKDIDPDAKSAQFIADATIGIDVKISIKDLLDVVKELHPDVLSTDVLEHYGMSVRPEGYYDGKAKFSLDDAYMHAVESGDMETAQKMVDDAAKDAGYDIKAYHGTSQDFSVFDKGKVGSNYGVDDYGFFFSSQRDVAEYVADDAKYNIGGEAKVLSVHLKISDPFKLTLSGDAITYFDNHTEEIINLAVADNDGIVLNGYNGSLYVTFNSEQIKSADPVTYDDNGNVIPLSQRFNVGNEDIRFSLKDVTPADTELIQADNEGYSGTDGTIEQQLSMGLSYDEKAVGSVARAILKQYNSAYDLSSLTGDLGRIFSYLSGKIVAYAEARDVGTGLMKKVLAESRSLDASTYEATKPVRDYLRNTGITLSEKQKAEAAAVYDGYGTYHRSLFGKVKLVNDGLPLDSAWRELAEMGWVDANTTEGDQVTGLMELASSVQKTYINEYGYDTDGYAYDMFLQAVYEYMVRKGDNRYVSKLHEQINAIRAEEKAKYQKRIADIRAKSGERYDKKLGEAKAQYRDRLAGYKQKQEERGQKEKYRKSIETKAKEMVKWLSSPNLKEGKYVPDALRGPVLHFLQNIDFTGSRGGKVKQTLWYNSIVNLRNEYNRYAAVKRGPEDYDVMQVADDFGIVLDDLSDSVAKAKYREVNQLNATELEELDYIIKNLRSAIRNANRTFRNRRFATAAGLGDSVLEYAGSRAAKEYRYLRMGQAFKDFMNVDMLDSYSFFDQFGEAGKSLSKELDEGMQKSFSRVRQASEFMESLKGEFKISAGDINGWNSEIHEFVLTSGEKVVLSTTQIMDMYNLNLRKQAQQHLLGGGIEISEIKSEKGSKIRQRGTFGLAESDVSNITGALTDQQRGVCDALMKYLSEECSAWGNEVTRERYGVDSYRETRYWPIRSSSSVLKTEDPDAVRAFNALSNSSFTKATNKHANNPIRIDDVFQVFSDHVAQMAQYNGLALPIDDLMKWINYQQRNEEGKVIRDANTKNAIERIAGEKAKAYLVNLVKDINGLSSSSYSTALPSKLMSNFKRSAVAGKLRVVIQQPTAIGRALAMIDGKYLLKATLKKHSIKEMQDNAPIAWWKAQGNYEIGVGRSLRSVIVGDDTGMTRLTNAAMAPAGFADDITWSHIWEAVKLEVKDRNPDLSQDAFIAAVVDRFSDIVNRTQVVDSVLHRSQAMRSKDLGVGQATAFMSEPTKSYNMLRSAIMEVVNGKDRKKAGKLLVRTTMAWLLSQVLNAVVLALHDTFRDRDEEDEFADMFLEKFVNESLDNINPFGMIPFMKEIVSLVQGYESSTMTMNAFSDLWRAVSGIYDQITGDSKRSLYYTVSSSAKAISNALGLPFGGMMASLETIVNGVAPGALPDKKPTAKDYSNKIYNASMDGDREKRGKLYDEAVEAAIASINESDQKRIAEGKNPLYSDSASVKAAARRNVETGIANVLKDYHDIATAYEYRKNGYVNKLDAVYRELKSLGFSHNEITYAINYYENAVTAGKTGSKTYKEENPYTEETFFAAASRAAKSGSYSEFDTVHKAMIKYSGAQDPDASVKSKLMGYIKDEMQSGRLSAAQAKNMLIRYGGYSGEDADAKVAAYEFFKDYPEYDGEISQEAIAEYNELCQPAGVTAKTYYSVYTFAGETKADVDSNGKAISGSKKEKVMAYINSLNIPNGQKDALYYACDYAKSTINEAPWH